MIVFGGIVTPSLGLPIVLRHGASNASSPMLSDGASHIRADHRVEEPMIRSEIMAKPKRGWAFKGQRVRQFLADVMIEQERAMTTGELYDLQRSRRDALTMPALANYLAKDPQFVQVGTHYMKGIYWSQMTWTHVDVAEQVLDEQEDDVNA